MKNQPSLAISLAAIFLLLAAVGHAELTKDQDKSILTVPIAKGWNLVPIYMVVDTTFDAGLGNWIIPGLPKEAVKMLYVLNPGAKKYISLTSFYNNGPNSLTPEEKEFLDTHALDIKEGAQDESLPSFAMSAMWLYSSEEGKVELKLNSAAFPEIFDSYVNNKWHPEYKGVKMYKGWNFFSITPDLSGRKLSSIVGDCNILKFGGWDNSRQVWGILDMADKSQYDYTFGEPSAPLSDGNVGMVFVIKVESDCYLKSAPIAGPPALP